MFIMKKLFLIKAVFVFGFVGQSFGSCKEVVAGGSIDLRSPVSQGGVEYPLRDANPASPLYEIFTQSTADKSFREFPVAKSSSFTQPFSDKEKEAIMRTLLVNNPNAYCITLESLRRHELTGSNDKAPKERYWVQQLKGKINTQEDAFFIIIEKLGKRDMPIFKGILHSLAEENASEEHCISVTTFPESRNVWINTKGCLIQPTLSSQVDKDCPFNEADGCFVVNSKF